MDSLKISESRLNNIGLLIIHLSQLDGIRPNLPLKGQYLELVFRRNI
jgi:hypothetical protein